MHECDICGKKTVTPEGLAAHKKAKHRRNRYRPTVPPSEFDRQQVDHTEALDLSSAGWGEDGWLRTD